MEHKGTVMIETDRLLLRRFEEADIEAAFRNWMSDEKVTKFLRWPTHKSVKTSEEILKGWICYCIGSKWWHQGIVSEAFTGIIPFLFNDIKVNRIESQHDPNNPNSGKVMLKCGLTYEGTLRQADFSNQGIVDASIYSLLSHEYIPTSHT